MKKNVNSNQIDDFGMNSRLRWRFAPLSVLHLVNNDSCDTKSLALYFAL